MRLRIGWTVKERRRTRRRISSTVGCSRRKMSTADIGAEPLLFFFPPRRPSYVYRKLHSRLSRTRVRMYASARASTPPTRGIYGRAEWLIAPSRRRRCRRRRGYSTHTRTRVFDDIDSAAPAVAACNARVYIIIHTAARIPSEGGKNNTTLLQRCLRGYATRISHYNIGVQHNMRIGIVCDNILIWYECMNVYNIICVSTTLRVCQCVCVCVRVYGGPTTHYVGGWRSAKVVRWRCWGLGDGERFLTGEGARERERDRDDGREAEW